MGFQKRFIAGDTIKGSVLRLKGLVFVKFYTGYEIA